MSTTTAKTAKVVDASELQFAKLTVDELMDLLLLCVKNVRVSTYRYRGPWGHLVHEGFKAGDDIYRVTVEAPNQADPVSAESTTLRDALAAMLEGLRPLLQTHLRARLEQGQRAVDQATELRAALKRVEAACGDK